MDPTTVVASGHSLGGYAAMVLAGGDDEVCDLADDPFDPWGRPTPPETCVPTLPDPRIKSIIPLDGSNQALWFYELARIDVPVLAMGQEWSALEAQGFADWQARQHAAFSGHPSYRVDVNNANHISFTAACTLFGFPCAWDSETHRLVNKYMVAFLTKQQSILTPGHAINSEPDIEFFVTEKRNPHAIDDDYPGHFVYFMHQSGKATAKAEKDSMNQPSIFYVGDQP
jgi:predicted dienelactone hydrolase